MIHSSPSWNLHFLLNVVAISIWDSCLYAFDTCTCLDLRPLHANSTHLSNPVSSTPCWHHPPPPFDIYSHPCNPIVSSILSFDCRQIVGIWWSFAVGIVLQVGWLLWLWESMILWYRGMFRNPSRLLRECRSFCCVLLLLGYFGALTSVQLPMMIISANEKMTMQHAPRLCCCCELYVP